jgi:hypothetical protein
MLQKAFKKDALSKTQVYEWYSRFKGGEMSSYIPQFTRTFKVPIQSLLPMPCDFLVRWEYYQHFKKASPSKLTQTVTLPSCFLEVPRSNRRQGINNPEKPFCGFSQYLVSNDGTVLHAGRRWLSSTFLTIHYKFITLPHATDWDDGSIVK